MPNRTAASHKPAPQARKAEPTPVITRITHDLELVAPQGCRASVLLKQLERDEGHRYYDWWLVVGRRGAETVPAVKYKADGGDVIRVDVPDDMPLRADALDPHVAAFLKNEGNEPADPPTVRD
jgi:hypothetical protein